MILICHLIDMQLYCNMEQKEKNKTERNFMKKMIFTATFRFSYKWFHLNFRLVFFIHSKFDL